VSTLAERLRGLVQPAPGRPALPSARSAIAGLRGEGEPASPAGVPAIRRSRPDAAATADALGGAWHDEGSHPVLVVERVYRPGHRHGHAVLADALPSSDGAWPGLSLLLGGAAPPLEGSGLFFLDLETTGLSGGAGTCAFLVGCAWFDEGVLRVRQYFLPSPGAEPALLTAVASLAGRAGTVVTYNGRSFDLPLIETRYLYHRMETPFADRPHLDLLHPARRLWRPDPDEGAGEASCRLTVLERTLCGMRREGDVPGFEIPARYFEYIRTGQARPLVPVLEHNRLDLVSLALLTARAARLVEEGPEAAQTPREALGLGRLYERARRFDAALACYQRAAARPGAAMAGSAAVIAEALRAQAVLCRRLRRHEEAAGAWQRLFELPSCPPAFAREAAQGLAVHHEHRLRDPRTARSLALRSLSHTPAGAWRQAVHHRIARLDRKLEQSLRFRE
jgi:uncharacterized protein